jgi:type VI protein secretion system component Hcp
MFKFTISFCLFAMGTLYAQGETRLFLSRELTCDSALTADLKSGLTDLPGTGSSVLAYQWAASYPIEFSPTGGRGAGKPVISTLYLQRVADECSPLFFNHLLQGKNIAKARLVLYSSDGKPNSFIDLETVYIAGLNQSSAGDRPGESLELAFEKVRVTVLKYSADGKTSTPVPSVNWSVAEQRPLGAMNPRQTRLGSPQVR